MANKFYIRRWLNKERHHAGAYVIADVKTHIHKGKDREGKETKSFEVDAELTLSDCSRVITLDLSTYGQSRNFDRDKKNALYKAHALRHSINQFLDAVEAAYAEIDDEMYKDN